MFKLKLNPELRRRSDMTAAEMERLFGLQDRWLGQALLGLARRAREENPQLLGRYEDKSYSDNFVWAVIPDLARRLGARLSPDEEQVRRARYESHERPSELVGVYLQNTSLRYGLDAKALDWSERVPATALLEHGFVNGNPVAFAVDRLAPPAPASDDGRDWLARHMQEVGRFKDGVAVAAWSPVCVTRSVMEHKPGDPVREIDLSAWEPGRAPEPDGGVDPSI